MKKYKTALVLMVLVLLAALGAKQYSTITMGDDEWIGLGASAGRIVFDNQATDEVSIMDARVGIGIAEPGNTRLAVTSGTTGSGDTTHPTFRAYARDVDSFLEVVNNASNSVNVNVYRSDSLRVMQIDGHNRTLTLDGDIRATGDVLAGGSVFIGSEEDAEEDGARMTTRADNSDGGYAFWAIRNFEGGVVIFDEEGDTGPEMVLQVQWLTHSNTTGAFTSGDAILINGPHAQDRIFIAGIDQENELLLCFYEDEVMLATVGTAGYLYDVTLQMMWVED